MKKIASKIIAVMTALIMLTLTAISGYAEDKDIKYLKAVTESKEENVYANLNYNGSKKSVYVVNHYSLLESKAVIDYGAYTELKNLSSSSDIKQTPNSALIKAGKGDLYFQGTVENELPWKIKINYYLNGKEIKADKIAGQSGHLEIRIGITKNEKGNSYFFENFAVQVNLELNTENCKNIKADGASISNYAKNKKIQFTNLPGKENQFIASADVKNFEMNGISINAGSFSLKIDSPDLSSLMGSINLLKSSIVQVNNGTGELKGGVDNLTNGVTQIKNGSELILNGMNQLNSSSNQLTEGSARVKDALDTMSLQITNFVNPIEKIYKTIKGTDTAKGIESTVQRVAELQEKYDQYKVRLQEQGLADDAINSLVRESDDISVALRSDITNIENCIADLEANNADGSNTATIESLKNTLKSLKSTLSLINSYFDKTSNRFKSDKAFIDCVYSNLNVLKSAMINIEDNIELILKLVENIPIIIDNYANSLFILRNSIQQLSDEYTRLDKGINDYTGAFSQIFEGYYSFYNGVVLLNNGSATLKQGASILNKGTTELNKKTNGIDEMVNTQVQMMIQNIVGGSDKQSVPSFVSENNTKIKSVQFAMTTPEILIKEEKPIIIQKKEMSLWQRFLALFL